MLPSHDPEANKSEYLIVANEVIQYAEGIVPSLSDSCI